MKEKNCGFCQKQFKYYESPKRSGRTKYCSIPCQRKGRHQKFWVISTEDQKLERMKKDFESKVIRKDNECWDWLGSLKAGYGTIKKDTKNIKAHRFSYELNIGIIPENMYVCHSCDNRKCTNPKHLFLGSHEDNIKDMLLKKRQKGAIGEKNIKAILNDKKVKEIKELLKLNYSIKDIAELFKVSFHVIYNIKINKFWKHVL